MNSRSYVKKDVWQHLEKKSRLHTLIMGKPKVKVDHHTITITSGNSLRMIGLFLLMVGLVIFSIEYLIKIYWGSSEYYHPVSIIVGAILLMCGLVLLTRRDSITWPGFGKGIYVRHGNFLFSVVYFLAMDNLQASLVINETRRGVGLILPNNSCLLTLTDSQKHGVVKVASASKREDLLGALNSLTAVIRGSGMEGSFGSFDQTVANLQLEKHRLRIYKGAINSSAMAIRSLRLVGSGSVVRLVRSRVEIALWGVLVFCGLLLLPLFWRLTSEVLKLTEYQSILLVFLCLVFSFVGGLGIYPGYDIQAVSFDKENARLTIDYGLIDIKNPRPRKLTINYNSLAAVQICPVYMDEFFSAYELNLVLISNQDRRVFLTGYFNLEKVREVADLIAKEIGCSVLDHTI